MQFAHREQDRNSGKTERERERERERESQGGGPCHAMLSRHATGTVHKTNFTM